MKDVPAGGLCVRRGSLLQNRLSVKFQDVKFKDPKLVGIDMKHSYFS